MKSLKRLHAAAFTLIELLTIIVIIMILFALLAGALNLAKDKQAENKTKVRISRIANALESYKLDKGIYPSTPDGDGSKNTNELFKDLYWDTDEDGTDAENDQDQPIYLKELDPKKKNDLWITGKSVGDYRIVDAWDNEIFYRSATDEKGNANNSTTAQDFDLWSAGKDGGTRSDPNSDVNRDDIRNR